MTTGSASSVIAIVIPAIAFSAALVLTVLVPVWRVRFREKRRPTRNEWDDLKKYSLTHRLGDVAMERGYSDATVHAARLIQGAAVGTGRLAHLGVALDLVDAPYEEDAHTLRIAAAQAIVCGLLATVLVLAFALMPMARSSKSSEDDFADVLKQHLPWVYGFNGFAILVGLGVGGWAGATKHKGANVRRGAQEALMDLQEAGLQVLAPELAAALKEVVEGFQTEARRTTEDQQNRIARTASEMKEVATNLEKTLVNVFGEGVGQRHEEAMQRIEEMETGFFALNARFDEAILQLAEPFRKGLPVLEKQAHGIEALESATADLVRANIPGAVTELRNAAEANRNSWNTAAERFKEALDGLGPRVGAELKNALEESLKTVKLDAAVGREELQRIRGGLWRGDDGPSVPMATTLNTLVHQLTGLQEMTSESGRQIGGLEARVSEVQEVVIVQSKATRGRVDAIEEKVGTLVQKEVGRLRETVSAGNGAGQTLAAGVAAIHELLERAEKSLSPRLTPPRGVEPPTNGPSGEPGDGKG
jgi:hypothetical protein